MDRHEVEQLFASVFSSAVSLAPLPPEPAPRGALAQALQAHVNTKPPERRPSVTLQLEGWAESGAAQIRATEYDPHGELSGLVDQEVPLPLHSEPARLRALFEAARAALPAVHVRDGAVLPLLLFPPDLLACTDDSAELREALEDHQRMAALVSARWLASFERAHDLPGLHDPALQQLLWWMHDEASEQWMTSATALRDRAATEAIPHVVCLLEGFQRKLDELGPYVFDASNHNAVVAFARVLEPLLVGELDAPWRDRVQALRERGLFDATNL